MFVSYIQPTGKDIQKQLDRLVEQKMAEYDAIKHAMASAQEIADKISKLEQDYKTVDEYKIKVNNLKKIA